MTGGHGKKRKGYYIQSAKAGKHARGGEGNDKIHLRPGCKGYLITFNGDRFSKEATLEAYRILNEYADQMYGPEKEEIKDEEHDEDINLEDALQKEVSEIKDANAKGTVRRFQRLQCKFKNIVFIESQLPDPSELLDKILADVLLTQVRKTKRILRFLPVVRTCHASTEEILKNVKEICRPIFVEQTDQSQPEKLIRFCFVWKVSCNSSLNRDDVLPELVRYVNSEREHPTDYVNPEIAVNMHSVGKFCFISVLKNFLKFNKYNIDSIVKIPHDEVKEKREAFWSSIPKVEEGGLGGGGAEGKKEDTIEEVDGANKGNAAASSEESNRGEKEIFIREENDCVGKDKDIDAVTETT